MKQLSLRGLFENNQFVRIFSVVAALLLWLFTAMTTSQTINRTVDEVPVNFTLQGEALENLGLDIIDGEDAAVSVQVNGPRTVVGQLTAEDLNITVRLGSVTEPGIYDLTVTSAGGDANYEIVNYNPRTVRVNLDRLTSEIFDITPVINGMSVAAGYMLNEEYVTPSSVRVTGPKTEIEKIETVQLTAEITEPLERTYAGAYDIELLDATGEAIDPNGRHMTVDVQEAQLVIPVLKVSGIPLNVDFIKIPRGFPDDDLLTYMDMSREYIEMAGPVDQVDGITEIQLGYIDISTIRIDQNTYRFDVELPSSQFQILDDTDTVTIKFNDSDWDSALFNFSGEIQLINEPAEYDVHLLAATLYNVEFVGSADIIAEMSAEDIVVEMDLSEREITEGQQSYPVKISAPTKGLVWAVGDYSVVIQVTEAVE